MNILIADKFDQAGLDGLRALGCAVFYEPAAGGEGSAPPRQGPPDVLVVRSAPSRARPWSGSPGLRAIIRAGAGVDSIDTAAATALGIAVANCRDERRGRGRAGDGPAHRCDRRIVDQTNELRDGTWNKKEYGKAKGLKGSTLGVVGPGRSGERSSGGPRPSTCT